MTAAASGSGGVVRCRDAHRKYTPTQVPIAMRMNPISTSNRINRRQGTPFWEVAAAAGKKARVVHIPVTFPAHDFPSGEMLSGLGVPDMSGRVGKPFYFTSELDFHHAGSSNEFSIQVVQLEDNKGIIRTTIQGPPNKLFGTPPYIAIRWARRISSWRTRRTRIWRRGWLRRARTPRRERCGRWRIIRHGGRPPAILLTPLPGRPP